MAGSTRDEKEKAHAPKIEKHVYKPRWADIGGAVLPMSWSDARRQNLRSDHAPLRKEKTRCYRIQELAMTRKSPDNLYAFLLPATAMPTV